MGLNVSKIDAKHPQPELETLTYPTPDQPLNLHLPPPGPATPLPTTLHAYRIPGLPCS